MVVASTIAYNLVCPLNTDALRVWRSVSAEDVEYILSKGQVGYHYTKDRQVIADLLGGLSWARYRSWADGMSANKTGRIYIVLRDGKTMYRLDFNAESPSDDVSHRFESALDELKAAPFNSDEYRALSDRITAIGHSK